MLLPAQQLRAGGGRKGVDGIERAAELVTMTRETVLVKSVTIPPRPYIGFGPKDEAATLREIEAWLALDGGSK